MYLTIAKTAMPIEQLLASNVKDVPVWENINLTLEEAAKYFGIGINKIRELSDDESCAFVLWNGNKRLIKRKEFEEYLKKAYSI